MTWRSNSSMGQWRSVPRIFRAARDDRSQQTYASARALTAGLHGRRLPGQGLAPRAVRAIARASMRRSVIGAVELLHGLEQPGAVVVGVGTDRRRHRCQSNGQDAAFAGDELEATLMAGA